MTARRLAVLATILLALSACGKKGPLQVPGREGEEPRTVEDAAPGTIFSY